MDRLLLIICLISFTYVSISQTCIECLGNNCDNCDYTDNGIDSNSSTNPYFDGNETGSGTWDCYKVCMETFSVGSGGDASVFLDLSLVRSGIGMTNTHPSCSCSSSSYPYIVGTTFGPSSINSTSTYFGLGDVFWRVNFAIGIENAPVPAQVNYSESGFRYFNVYCWFGCA